MRGQASQLGISHGLRNQDQCDGQSGNEIGAQNVPVFEFGQPVRQFEWILELPQRMACCTNDCFLCISCVDFPIPAASSPGVVFYYAVKNIRYTFPL